MATEDTTKISGLVATNPESTDPVSKGDNHLRMIKDVLKKSFPSDIQVHIPNTEGQDNKFLVVDGTQPTWADPIDWRATLGMNGQMVRSRFVFVDDNHIRIYPGSYHVSGVGIVNLDWTAADSPIDISLIGSAEGWNYIYIDQSEVSSALSADPYARMSITDATSADFIGHSSIVPVYNPMKHGMYINEEDRVIFAYYWENGLVKFFHDGSDYVNFASSWTDSRRVSSGKQQRTVRVPKLIGVTKRAFLSFWMGSTDGNTWNSLANNFYASTDGVNEQFLGRVEHGDSLVNAEHNTNSQIFAIEDDQVWIRKDSGGSPSNFCTVTTHGFFLPGGM